MNRTTQIRLERLEEAHLLSAIPHRVLSSCPLPDEPASHAVILEWLDEGLAAPKGEKRPADANRNNLRNLSRLRNINSLDVPIFRFNR